MIETQSGEVLKVDMLGIDENTLPLLVLMVIGTTAPGRWDDVSLARLFEIKPSEARAVLNDLEDWGMIYATGIMRYTISYRGTQNLRSYMPGRVVPRG